MTEGHALIQGEAKAATSAREGQGSPGHPSLTVKGKPWQPEMMA